MKRAYLLSGLFLLSITYTFSQVTIGSNKAPEDFSALELISNRQAGLRMPLLTTEERNAMQATQDFQDNKGGLAKGLAIYNTTINCLEFWNGTKWISTCQGETPPYIPATPSTSATVTACGAPFDHASVDARSGFYMFTYQTMHLYASTTPYANAAKATSYQWVVDGKLVPGATGATYAYTPPADIALTEDSLGNRKKTVKITCQMEIKGKKVQPASDFNILVVHVLYEDKDGDGRHDLQPVYVWGHKDGISGAESVKVAFAHVNLGAENDIDPCNCKGDFYQWGRVADGHQLRTSEGYPHNDNSSENGAAKFEDLDANGQIAEGNPRYGKFIKQDDRNDSSLDSDSISWRPNQGMSNLWGDGQTTYSSQPYDPVWAIPANNPCPSGWKVPSQKQWGAIYQGGTTAPINGAPGLSTSGSTWTKLGGFFENATGGYKVADALYLPAAGFRSTFFFEPWLAANVGYQGHYSSSTVYNSANSYYLSFENTDVNPGNYRFFRANGASVRCVRE